MRVEDVLMGGPALESKGQSCQRARKSLEFGL